jgi:basic amino acid/polyamine antiporter, APA family
MTPHLSTGSPQHAAALQRTISPIQFALFGFGSIVGTAWVVLLGGWLTQAGPAGTLVGIAVGGASMALIAAMYAELGSRFPQTGGEVTYVTAVFGKPAGFTVGWLLTLAYLSNLVFEGIALGWLAEMLLPSLSGPTLYVILGQPIRAGSLLLALASASTIAILNYRGAHSFVRFQNGLTITFLAIVLTIVGVELYFGTAANMQPLWRAGNGGSWYTGAIWVFGSVPMIFNGFQSVLHTIEERSPSTSKEVVVRFAVTGVCVAICFYLLAVVAATKAAPWVSLAAGDLPAADALARLPWSPVLTTVFLLGLIASLLKAWNAVFMTAVRLLFAQSREGMIPAIFTDVNAKTGAPGKAVIIVATVNLVGIFIGKGLLEPIVNAMTVCIASIYALICAATLVMRRRDPTHVGFRAWGGTPLGIYALVAAAGMVVFALLQPQPTGKADALKWVLLATWAILGLGLYLRRNQAALPSERASAV